MIKTNLLGKRFWLLIVNSQLGRGNVLEVVKWLLLLLLFLFGIGETVLQDSERGLIEERLVFGGVNV